MRFRRPRKKVLFAKFDLTAFVDVMFQLLIFFMCTSTFAYQSSVPVELPEKDSDNPVQVEAKDIVVSVVNDSGDVDQLGSIYLEPNNETPVPLEELAARLQVESNLHAAPAGDIKPMVLIRADGRVPTQRIIDVMEACEEAGLRSFGIGVSAESR